MRTSSSATLTAGPTPPRSADAREAESLVRSALDDIAFVIGGAANLHRLDDSLVWTVMRRFDSIRVRLLRDLKGLEPSGDREADPVERPRVHAAVEEFLARNRAGMEE